MAGAGVLQVEEAEHRGEQSKSDQQYGHGVIDAGRAAVTKTKGGANAARVPFNRVARIPLRFTDIRRVFPPVADDGSTKGASMGAGDMAGMAAWTLTGGRLTNLWLRPRQAAGRPLISAEKGLEMRSRGHFTVTRRPDRPA